MSTKANRTRHGTPGAARLPRVVQRTLVLAAVAAVLPLTVSPAHAGGGKAPTSASTTTYTAPFSEAVAYGGNLLSGNCLPTNGCASSGHADRFTGEARGSVAVDNPTGVFHHNPQAAWGEVAGATFKERYTLPQDASSLTVTAKVLVKSADVSLSVVSLEDVMLAHAGSLLYFHSTNGGNVWSRSTGDYWWRVYREQPGTASAREQEVTVTTSFHDPERRWLKAGEQIDIFSQIRSGIVSYYTPGRAVAIKATANLDAKLLSLVVTPGS